MARATRRGTLGARGREGEKAEKEGEQRERALAWFTTGWERIVPRREEVSQTGGREREREGGGPREGAVPPCRPPAVRATRYH